MAAQEPIDPRVRLAIAQWPDDDLPGRVTPVTAWEITAKAEPPRPKAEQPQIVASVIKHLQPRPVPTDLPAGTHVRKLTSHGTFMLATLMYMVGGQYGFQQILVDTHGDHITVIDLHGAILSRTHPTRTRTDLCRQRQEP